MHKIAAVRRPQIGIGIALGLGLLAQAGAAATAPQCGDWEMVAPTPHGRDLADVAYGAGRFVAVGYSVTQWSADDGATWAVTAHDGVHLNGVAFDGAAFAAVGDGGVVWRSVDGETWEPQATPTNADLHGIVFADGRLVAVGDRGTILTSVSGLSWTVSPVPTTAGLLGVVYGDGHFYAFGQQDVVLEGDGTTWIDTGLVTSLAGVGKVRTLVPYGDQLFALTYSEAYRRVNGSWHSCTNQGCWFPTGIERLAVHAGTLYAIGATSDGSDARGQIRTSVDAVTWTAGEPMGATPFRGLAVTGGTAVAVGREGTVAARGSDGSWRLTAGAKRRVLDVATDGENFVAVAMDRDCPVLTSPDGRDWHCQPGAQGGDRIFHVGGRFVILSGAAPRAVSLDGFTWFLTYHAPNAYTKDLLEFHGRILALGGLGSPNCPFTCAGIPPSVYSTDDLMQWRLEWEDPLFAGQMVAGASDGNRVVAVRCTWTNAGGWSCGLLESDDATVWTQINLPLSLPPSSKVRWTGSQFVVAGGKSLLTSPDGIVWTLGPAQGVEITSLAWSGFELLGAGAWEAYPLMATLESGKQWRAYYPFVQPNACTPLDPFNWEGCAPLTGLAATPRIQLAVGQGGILLRRECTVESGRPRRHLQH